MEKPVILIKSSELIIQIMLVISVSLFIRGHNEPGGGFLAGLVAGISFFLYIFFHDPAIRRIKFISIALLIFGFLSFLLSIIIPMFNSKSALSGDWIQLSLLHSHVKLGTPLLFDLGVYLCVTSTIIIILLLLKSELYDFND